MDIQTAIKRVIERQDLSAEEMAAVMRGIMTGEATPAQIGGFLVAMRMKGESVNELTAAASVMRELATHVDVSPEHLVDTCGTGGDGARTFNISTASAIVAAAAGARVAKHGNRSVSSSCGSADVLEAAGVNLDLDPAQVARCVEKIGVGFLFAPKHHSAMKHAIGPRKELGVRTLFNLLGPLTNPAGAPNQVMGVFSDRWVEPVAAVLRQLGSEHVLVVHSDDGLDEISIGAPTRVAELRNGEIGIYRIHPANFGMDMADVTGLAVNTATESLAVIKDVFSGKPGPARDVVVLNAGAAIYAAGLADTLASGVTRAGQVLDQGLASEKLDELIRVSHSV